MTRRLRHATVVLLGCFAVVSLGSFARGQQLAPVAAGHGGDVVMIHGLAGYWPGCDRFKKQVEQSGYRAWDYPMVVAPRLAHTIANQRKKGGMRGPLCLVGYSRGADQAVSVAGYLQSYGITVDRLILIEPTIPGRIPPNVQYCFNLYESRPLTDLLPVFRGVRVDAVNPGSSVVNYDVSQRDRDLARNSHFTMATSDRVQQMAISQAIAKPTMRR